MCTNYQQHGHTLQFCRNGLNRNQRTNNNGPQQNLRGPSQNQGNNRGPPPRGQIYQSTEKNDFHHLCGRYHVIRECWSENQGQVCNNCGGPQASNQCSHPDKVSGTPNRPTNPTQSGQENTRGSQNEGNNTLKPSNFYYDDNTNLPGQVTQSPKQMGPSTSQDVRFMNSSTVPVNLEMSANGQGPCLPHANSISYELKSLKEEIMHKAPALAVITRAMRGNAPLEVEEEEEEEENPSGGIPYFLDLE